MATNPRRSLGQPRWSVQGDFHVGISGPNAGLWIPIDGVWPWTVALRTVPIPPGSLSALLLVSNQITKPLDADNDWPTLYTFTAAQVVMFNEPVYWAKLRVVTLTGGTLSASVVAAHHGP